MDESRTGSTRRGFVRGAALAGAAVAIPQPWVRRAYAGDLRPITFLFDVSVYGKHALFYPAIDQGFFRDVGLDVTFQSGKGSADVVVKVAVGAVEAGFADAATSILARGKGAKTKQVMMIHYKSMINCVTMASKPVRKPKDLEGKKMGTNAGDSARVALPALAEINGFDASKVDIVTMDSPSKPAMFVAHRVDGLLGLDTYTPVLAAAARRIGEDVVEMSFRDWGLDIYSNGIVMSDDVLSRDPGLAKGIVNALARSCIYAVENPDAALKIFLRYNPAANAEISLAELNVAINHLMVPEVREHGVGPMSEKKMAFTLDIVRKYFGLEGAVNIADTYSNDFVTPGQKPRAT